LENIQYTACFTGHRPDHANGFRFSPEEQETADLTRHLDAAIIYLAEKKQVNVFLCGMADGFDLFAGRRVLALKRTGRIPDTVALIAVLPYIGHGKDSKGRYWSAAHREILESAQDQFVVSERRGKDVFKRRNAAMVDRSQYVIAYWNHAFISGTGQTVRMAQRANREILNLYDEMHGSKETK